MRLGIIVDGQAEYRSLGSIYGKVNTGFEVLKPLYADLQPKSGPAKLVHAAMPAIKIFAGRNVERILVLLDHENRPECIPTRRRQLENALSEAVANTSISEIKVTLKAQMYENWLISDLEALKAMPKRFKLSNAMKNQIFPNKADSADALRILKNASQGDAYHKVKDAILIMSKLEPYKAAANSRSFRRFLRLLGCEIYHDQSKIPAT